MRNPCPRHVDLTGSHPNEKKNKNFEFFFQRVPPYDFYIKKKIRKKKY
jgi:hypothetical protein